MSAALHETFMAKLKIFSSLSYSSDCAYAGFMVLSSIVLSSSRAGGVFCFFLIGALGWFVSLASTRFPAEYCAGKWSASSLSGLIVEADQYKYAMK